MRKKKNFLWAGESTEDSAVPDAPWDGAAGGRSGSLHHHREGRAEQTFYCSCPSVQITGEKDTFSSSNLNIRDPSIAIRKNISNCRTFSTVLKLASKIAFFDAKQKHIFLTSMLNTQSRWKKKENCLLEKCFELNFVSIFVSGFSIFSKNVDILP